MQKLTSLDAIFVKNTINCYNLILKESSENKNGQTNLGIVKKMGATYCEILCHRSLFLP